MPSLYTCPSCNTNFNVNKTSGFINCPVDSCEERLELAAGVAYIAEDEEDDYENEDDDDLYDEDDDTDDDEEDEEDFEDDED